MVKTVGGGGKGESVSGPDHKHEVGEGAEGGVAILCNERNIRQLTFWSSCWLLMDVEWCNIDAARFDPVRVIARRPTKTTGSREPLDRPRSCNQRISI